MKDVYFDLRGRLPAELKLLVLSLCEFIPSFSFSSVFRLFLEKEEVLKMMIQ
jgi:hypothetical protein